MPETNNELFLPGFEYLASDAEKHAEDKRLKKEILRLVTEMTDQQNQCNSPAKIATWERDLKALMKQREDLWKEKGTDA